jgi:hydroxypyruvate reductase
MEKKAEGPAGWLKAALEAVIPQTLVARKLVVDEQALGLGPHKWPLRPGSRIFLISLGKAAEAMARAAKPLLWPHLAGGLVITPHPLSNPLEGVEVHLGGHPFVDDRVLMLGEKVQALADEVREGDLLLCLISGGGSALIFAPRAPLSLHDVQEANRLLLESGLDIHAVNTVRRHLGAFFGGRLGALFDKAEVFTGIISDVLGNDPAAVASGPTSPDATTYSDALAVARTANLPAPIIGFLDEGRGGKHPETPKPGRLDHCAAPVVLGDLSLALNAFADAAQIQGAQVRILNDALCGEASEVGKALGLLGRHGAALPGPGDPPLLLLCGGETTVRLRGQGRGGRNLELCLAAALALEGTEGCQVFSFGLDGVDGVTDAAGAVVDGKSAARARHAGVDPVQALADNDSLAALDAAKAVVRTGSTHTNVGDLMGVVFPRRS